MDFSGCLSCRNSGQCEPARWTCHSPHLCQRTSQCAGRAHLSSNVEMCQTGRVMSVFSITGQALFEKLVAWDGILRAYCTPKSPASPPCFPAWATASFSCMEWASCARGWIAVGLPPWACPLCCCCCFSPGKPWDRMKFGCRESPYSGMTRGLKGNLFPFISLLTHLFPNKRGNMDLAIFINPETFFSKVLNGRCHFILGFNFNFLNGII